MVSWTEDGVRRTERRPRPRPPSCAELAARFPGEVPELAVARPTLEDVYLRMIGEPVMTTTDRSRGACRRWPRSTAPRVGVELKEFFRQRESVVFTLLFPVILLLVFGAVLNYDIGVGVNFTQYFMAGVIAAGILGASLQNMAISIATERSDGTLKSLAGTPMPKSAYFVGKVVQVLAVTVLIIAILLAIGVALLRRRPAVGQPTGSPSPG